MKVGKSGDIVCVRSTTLLKLLDSAAGAGTAVAANPAAAAAPLKNPRLLKATRTMASHPATHIFVYSAAAFKIFVRDCRWPVRQWQQAP
jgi:hypothetical protein